MLVLAGCGVQSADSGTSRDLPTSIPAATSLPPLPTVAPLGSAENPIVVLLVVPDVASATAQSASLGEALSADIKLMVAVQVTDTYPKARAALCGRSAAVVSMDSFSAMAAQEADCGEIAFVLEKNGEAATHGQFIARDVFLPQSYRGVFCRPDENSLNGWVIPALTLQSRGVDPFTDFFNIVDAGSDEEVVRKVDSGECGLGATSAGAEQDVRGLRFPDRLRVLEELAPVPNDVILRANSVDPGLGSLVDNALASHTDEIAHLIGGDQLQHIDPGLFEPLSTLFSDAKIDPVFFSQ